MNPLNRYVPARVRIGTSLNVKPLEEIEGHTPEFGEPNTYENVPYQLPKITPYEPVKPKEYSPHSPNFEPATQLNNSATSSERAPSVNLNKVTPLNLNKSSSEESTSATSSNNEVLPPKISRSTGNLKLKNQSKK